MVIMRPPQIHCVCPDIEELIGGCKPPIKVDFKLKVFFCFVLVLNKTFVRYLRP